MTLILILTATRTVPLGTNIPLCLVMHLRAIPALSDTLAFKLSGAALWLTYLLIRLVWVRVRVRVVAAVMVTLNLPLQSPPTGWC